jgi:branched-subunit amino acid ABC-type transport system permease component
MWVTAAVAMPLAALWLLKGGSDPWAVRSAAFGAALAGLNAIVAYALVLWAQNRTTKAFMAAVLGGMLGRMALLLGAVVAGIGVLELRRLPLVTGLLGYFVFFLIVELTVLHRATTSTSEATR